MGKALVINGLVVTNPIAVVTFKTADSVLQNYLALNETINATEKAALREFVGGLIDAELWPKFKYFYPMLGNAVADMIIDVVNPATEDLFSNDTTVQRDALVIANRCLVAGTDDTSSGTTQRDFTARAFANPRGLDATKIGFIGAIDVLHSTTPSNNWWSLVEYFSNQSITASKVGVQYGTGQPTMAIDANGTGADLAGINDYTSTERIIFANYNGGSASIYRNDTRQNTQVFTSTTIINRLFYLFRGKGTIYFNAITDGMTEEDWGVVYPLLLAFLQAVGKHA